MKPTGGPVSPAVPQLAGFQPQTGGAPQHGQLTAVLPTSNYGNTGGQFYGQGSLTGTVAFPPPPSYTASYTYHGEFGEQGLTIRDHFASQALVGFMLWEGAGAQATFSPTEIAKRCFAVADAMLEERARE